MATLEDVEVGYLAVADQLRAYLLAGRYRPGDALPSTRELAEETRYAKDTIAKAYAILADEGFIDLRHRSRPLVRNAEAIRDARFDKLRNKISAFRAHLLDLGYTPREIDAALRRINHE